MLHTYMITGNAEPERLAHQILRALDTGVERVQIRRKGSTASEIESILDIVIRERRDSRPKLFVNDRLDIALARELAGVHLPADGVGVAAARRVAPPVFEIGASVHDTSAARDAERDGANFVVFGPVFATRSKPGHHGVGLESLRQVVDALTIPVYALGGITAKNLSDVAATGVFGVSGISAFESESALQELMACR